MAGWCRTLTALGLTTALLPCLALSHSHDYHSTLGLCSAPIPPSTPADLACPPPVDDAMVWPPHRSAWTHPPECEHSNDRASKYCVYTHSGHGSRGWSIITSPETAADSIAFLSKPLNSSSLGSPSQQEPAYKMVDIPGKGKGLVATRAIKQYDEILVDYATVLVDVAFATKVPAFLGYRLLHTAVDQLADPESVLGLGKSNGFARDEVENVLRTNGFHTPLGGEPHIAVYPAVSVSVWSVELNGDGLLTFENRESTTLVNPSETPLQSLASRERF